MKHLYTGLPAFVLALFFSAAQAQIVTTTPAIVQESSNNVVLTYHADSPLGNGGLKNLPASEIIYAHIGAITNLSQGTGDWKYVLTPWPESDGSNAQTANTAKNRLTYVSANTYSLTIGNIRQYFGITNPNETVEKIAIVFRTADGRKEGKAKDGGNIYVDVHPAGFATTFTTDGSTLLTAPAAMNFTVQTTEPAAISIAVDGAQIASKASVTELTAQYTFSERHCYRVTATATSASGEKAQKSIVVSYPAASTGAAYPGGIPEMGARRNPDGTVTFCLAAPGKSSAILVPSWDNYDVLDQNIMKYYDYGGQRYFWVTTSQPLPDDTWLPYYYLVDMTYRVADPYAHLVLDCWYDKWLDPSIWPDMPKYPYERFDDIMLGVYRHDSKPYAWSNFTIPEHKDLIVYEMLFRDFTGTEGQANANGTVRKAIEKIPYLHDLGVNAVELMPIMEFNGNVSWGYNTNFYMAPDKAYGSPDDYKDFIETCHRYGMAVILDIVFNQSDGLHPWYQLYNISKNPFYNQTAPHDYSVLNDWNQGNPLVQQQWTDALKYWMEEYNVDGYRFDLVKGLGDNSSYANGTDAYNQSRIDRMKRLHAVIKSVKPNGIHINEDLAGAAEEIELGNDGQLQWANINGNSCQFTMGYAESTADGALTSAFLSTANGGRPWGSTVSYAESHDEQRMAYKNNTWGISTVKDNRSNSYKRLGSLAAIMLMTPGPKMIWQFGELGADQNTKNPDNDNNTDPKIVIWSWLDDTDPAALHDTYQALCWLRRLNPDLFSEQAEFVTTGLGGGMAEARMMRLTNGDKEAVLFVNPTTGGNSKSFNWTATKLSSANSRLIACSPGITPRLNGSNGTVNTTLPPHSFALFATKSVSGTADITVDPAEPTIDTSNGQISVTGPYTTLEVYDLAGHRCPAEGLSAGIYIVRIDGTATKVALH